MSQDMDARAGRTIPDMDDRSGAVLRLRVERFDLMTRVIGCESDLARASLIGVAPKTVYRARQGIVGEVFVARTIAALRRHESALAQLGLTATLDDLFEVVDEPAAVAA